MGGLGINYLTETSVEFRSWQLPHPNNGHFETVDFQSQEISKPAVKPFHKQIFQTNSFLVKLKL